MGVRYPDRVSRGERDAQRWLAQARRDQDDAGFAASGARWNLTCFLAQQAAEKALRAYLLFRSAGADRTHSVAELCREAGAHDAAFVALGAEAAALDQFYIPTRYPNGLPGGIPADAYTRTDGERGLALCRAVIELVASRAATAR